MDDAFYAFYREASPEECLHGLLSETQSRVAAIDLYTQLLGRDRNLTNETSIDNCLQQLLAVGPQLREIWKAALSAYNHATESSQAGDLPQGYANGELASLRIRMLETIHELHVALSHTSEIKPYLERVDPKASVYIEALTKEVENVRMIVETLTHSGDGPSRESREA